MSYQTDTQTPGWLLYVLSLPCFGNLPLPHPRFPRLPPLWDLLFTITGSTPSEVSTYFKALGVKP